ncbi:S8 family serine peptidase [Shewanella woodyi]|uniref:S8 family serine peptidase n=1 Tax=Shewanella woodyi TaxID=60961 RepID=UPI00374A6CDA
MSATNPYSSISRSYFSNYGTRIDFNAWGNNVAAAGLYGNTLFNGGINQRYGDGFSGTSSASPIVAGAVAILQGYSKHTKGQTLPPQTIKNILTSTGVQEPSGVQVGIRPNLKTAIQLLDSSVDLIMTAPRLSSNWEGCYGANSIFWNSIPNATFYKIFLNGNYWKSTSSTYTFVNVTRSSSSAVQACNSTLCSELSNQVTLRYSPSSECY